MTGRFRIAVASTLVGLGLVLFSGVSIAQSPPPPAPSVAVSTTNPAPGEEITVSGSGFRANSTAALVLGAQVLREVRTSAQGAFTEKVEIPCGFPAGPTTLSVRGVDAAGAPRTVNSAITVADDPCPVEDGRRAAGGALARTGSDSSRPLTVAGVGAVLIGALAVLVARRRRGAHAGL